MINTDIIYEPTGRAGEYGELAANWYNGCNHGCWYCYAPAVVRRDRADFHKNPYARNFALDYLKNDCIKLCKANDQRAIFCSFTCDPYQLLEASTRLTRICLITLFNYDRKVILLTKGGHRSMADFDLLQAHREQVQYGTTLVYLHDEDARKYEPKAAPTSERIEALKVAHTLGIRTWVSLEPVVLSMQTLKLIDATHEFVDHYKVGMLNHHPEISKNTDWLGFATAAIEKLEGYGKDYYIKKDLKKAAGMDE